MCGFIRHCCSPPTSWSHGTLHIQDPYRKPAQQVSVRHPKNTFCADLLRTAKLIIWDEVGAQHRHAIKALDRTLRDVQNNESLFGGLTTIFGGDFQQTLPVVVRGSREETVDATLIHSELWDGIEVLHL